ncbi:MAG TPA: CoA ester lyase [Candidatus Binatia bacterium]|nr:CoA ester lyase [Candidatus Binatia bacterium]
MRSRRSCLSVPGSSPRMLAKAAFLGADEVILDLEDAVAPAVKDAARGQVIAAIRGGDWAGKTVAIRVNGVETRWCYRDVIEVVEGARGRLDCIVIPKVERAADVAFVDRLLTMVEETCGVEPRVKLELLIETAVGLENLRDVARASPRIETLILDPADMSASLGLPAGAAAEHGDRWHWIRSTILLAARAAGLQAIDGPHLDVGDTEGLRRAAQQARALGYDGKWALHPGQLDPLNAVFAPSQEEFDRAAAVLEAYAHATGSQSRGAVRFGSEMIDEASRKLAVQCVARGQAAGLRPTKTWADFQRE